MDDSPKRHAPRGPIKARDSDPTNGPDLINGQQCTATNKKRGDRCRKQAIRGAMVCRFHGGAAPQVKLKAEERLRAFQDRAIDRLFQLAEDPKYPSTSYQAVRDVLDRTMGRPVEKVEAQITGELTLVEGRLLAARKRLAGAAE